MNEYLQGYVAKLDADCERHEFCVWADGVVCFYDEVEAYLGFMSDDYVVVDAVDEEHAMFKAGVLS